MQRPKILEKFTFVCTIEVGVHKLLFRHNKADLHKLLFRHNNPWM
jgi:hypothetical protein